ncbi:hypothetical protein ACE38W_13795 [Chitinophaga sp. Hz27]|uniref:hypothetical protein n=1 Tax=Chitinophaga sp. Hz27 TaxID=3347169 RepID=UPI0035DB3428
MKSIIISCMLLLGAVSSFASTNNLSESNLNGRIQLHAVAKDDSTFTVTVVVVTEILGLEVPINLAVVSTGLVGGLLTNVLGIAPPLDVKAGDIITVSAIGFETKSFAFDPGVTNYLNSDSQARGNVTINAKLRILK